MKTPTSTALDRSNSLTDLAARIRTEHDACTSALQRGLEHAIAAGRLLLEAKGQVPHGQWLAWLRDNVQIPKRTAQRYMEVAPHAPEIKNDKMAHLTGDALKALPPPRSPHQTDTWEELSAWAQQRLDCPFTPQDLESDLSVFMAKLMHQAGVPPLAAFCFSMREDDLNTLHLCPYDELHLAGKALAPIVMNKRALKVDAPDMNAMREVIVHIEICAMWLLGGLLDQLERRDRINDKTYAAEWDAIHAKMMTRIERDIDKKRLVELRAADDGGDR